MRPVVSSSRNACQSPSDARGSGESHRRVFVRIGVSVGVGVGDDLSDDPDAEAVPAADGWATKAWHGVAHRILTTIAPADAEREAAESRKTIAEALGADVRSFAYPNGDWNDAVVGGVHRAGYNFAFTTEPGLVSSHDEPFTLRRVNVHDGMSWTMPMFLARILGVA